MIDYIKNHHLALIIVAYLVVSSFMGAGATGAPSAVTTFTNPIEYDQTVTVSGDFTVDSNDLFADVSADRVGVGTSTPLEQFHLANAPAGDGTTASTTFKGGAATSTSAFQMELQQDDGGTSCAYINTAGTAWVVQDGACN